MNNTVLSSDIGTLYLVPTPIGNLADMTERAVLTLREVDVVAAEDTRHSGQLLQHLGVKAEMLALHDHNERDRAGQLIARLQQGQSIALISDAGMPLISDPGYHLVSQCRAAGVPVCALPGPCALITALAASGLPTDKFIFEGFLPAKPQQRRKTLQSVVAEARTLVFYESPHRIVSALEDILTTMGPERPLVLARELTKRFETYLVGTVAEVLAKVTSDSNQQRGEFVLMLGGAAAVADEAMPAAALQLLTRLQEDLPLKKAAAIVAEMYGLKKNELYSLGLERQKS